MSTSNIKSPVVIRQGYVKSWEKEDLGFEFNIPFLKWELNKQNVTSVGYLYEDKVLSVFYYKWIQLPFKSKISQRPLLFVKQAINSADFLDQSGLAVARSKYKLIKRQKRMALIDGAIRDQKTYQVPFIVQAVLLQSLVEANSIMFKKICFINIFKQVELSHKLLDLKKFVNETPLVKGSIKSIYHVLDMVVISDLFSLKICNGELMGKLIGKLLERSSKKGLFIRSLRILSKLPALIKKSEIKKGVDNNRSWNWGIKITGKIGGKGRTKVYNTFSKKMPLHTINNNIDYSETIVNTKAGSFSIKVWALQ